MPGGGGLLHDLDSMLTTVSSLDPATLPAADLAGGVLRVEQLLNAVHALSAVLLDRFDRDGGWAEDGAPSAAAWTTQRTGSARASLRSRRQQGAALRHLPAAAVEARAGRLSTDHLRALAECARQHPERAEADERVLLDQAAALDAGGFGTMSRRWLAHVDDLASPDPADHDGQGDEVSRLYASRTFDGWLRLDGWLAPQDADLVEAALGAGFDRALRVAHDGDPSVAGQPPSALRAMALVDLAGQSMRQEPSDASAPDRYRVAVVVHAGEAAVPGEAACDASAFRAVLGVDSEVLDVGRQTSRWPIAIRRAVTIRDGGCIFPGCDRPPPWCDIHHCMPWREGGVTAIDNGALLCRRHHTFIHRQRWRVVIEEGRPCVARTDGTFHVIERWQLHAHAS